MSTDPVLPVMAPDRVIQVADSSLRAMPMRNGWMLLMPLASNRYVSPAVNALGNDGLKVQNGDEKLPPETW